MFSVEHTLSVCSGIFRVSICTNSTDFDGFVKRGWPQIYTFVKYDGGFRGVLGEFINYYCVLQWVFVDLLIISISICLSTRFHQLNGHLKQFKGMVSNQFVISPFHSDLMAIIRIIHNTLLLTLDMNVIWKHIWIENEFNILDQTMATFYIIIEIGGKS